MLLHEGLCSRLVKSFWIAVGIPKTQALLNERHENAGVHLPVDCQQMARYSGNYPRYRTTGHFPQFSIVNGNVDIQWYRRQPVITSIGSRLLTVRQAAARNHSHDLSLICAESRIGAGAGARADLTVAHVCNSPTYLRLSGKFPS